MVCHFFFHLLFLTEAIPSIAWAQGKPILRHPEQALLSTEERKFEALKELAKTSSKKLWYRWDRRVYCIYKYHLHVNLLTQLMMGHIMDHGSIRFNFHVYPASARLPLFTGVINTANYKNSITPFLISMLL